MSTAMIKGIRLYHNIFLKIAVNENINVISWMKIVIHVRFFYLSEKIILTKGFRH